MVELSNTLILAIIALANAFTAFLVYRTHIIAQATAANVAIVERATNSMKDALVVATGKASRAEGIAAGIKIGEENAERKLQTGETK